MLGGIYTQSAKYRILAYPLLGWHSGMTVEQLSSTTRRARELATALVVDDVTGRRDLLSRVLQPEHEVVACRNFREAVTCTRTREYLATFVAWKSVGSTGIGELAKSGCTTRKLIAIFETESEGIEASETCKRTFPEAALELLHAVDGRLSVAAVLGTLSPRAQHQQILASSQPSLSILDEEGQRSWLDVFLSVKSEDYRIAERLFVFLTSRGLKVFFAPLSVRQCANSNFNEEIERALDQARHMIVVTSSPEHLRKNHVAYEWRAFHNEKAAGRKSGNLLTLAANNICISDLPLCLRNYQMLQFCEETFEDVLPYLYR